MNAIEIKALEDEIGHAIPMPYGETYCEDEALGADGEKLRMAWAAKAAEVDGREMRNQTMSDKFEFKAPDTRSETGEVTIEVYYDDQDGCKPGWCWRGKGADSVLAGGDVIEDVDANDGKYALELAKNVWGM